jgi:hypothetical protein
LKGNIVNFASLSDAMRVIPETVRKIIEAARVLVEALFCFASKS